MQTAANIMARVNTTETTMIRASIHGSIPPSVGCVTTQDALPTIVKMYSTLDTPNTKQTENSWNAHCLFQSTALLCKAADITEYSAI